MIGSWLFEYIGSWFGYSSSGPTPDPAYAPNTELFASTDTFSWTQSPTHITFISQEGDIFTWIEAGDDL